MNKRKNMRGREMREGTRRSQRLRDKKGGEDRISQLPKPLIHDILSLLPAKDAVRTGVLSKHWKDQWKFTTNLNLDQKTMPSDEIEEYVHSTRVEDRLDIALGHPFNPNCQIIQSMWNPIVEAENLIGRVIDQHIGPLTSCRIQHMIESVGVAHNWMWKLLEEKNVKVLSMERDPPTGSSRISGRSLINPLRVERASQLHVPFHILAGFEVIELTNYHLYTSPPPSFDYPQKLKTIKLTHVFIPPVLGTFLSQCLSLESIILIGCGILRQSVRINNPNVKLLNMTFGCISYIEICAINLETLVIDSVFCEDPKYVVIVAPNLKVLHCYYVEKGHSWGLDSGFEFISQILEGLVRDVTLDGKKYPTVCENLRSLHVQLNLRNERDSMLLAKVLESCKSLVNLEIENEDMEELDDEQHDRERWRMGSFKCITEKLKTVSIRGFKGKELELDFVKCLVTKSEKMKNITIRFDDDSKLENATETMSLLSLQKSSASLSITLKPGKQYIASVGGSFEEWISTLKD